MEFYEKPPRVNALQWDGTYEGAKEIDEFLAQQRNHRNSLRIVRDVSVRASFVTVEHLEIREYQDSSLDSAYSVLRCPTDFWVVVKNRREGELEIWPPESFKHNFQEVEV